MANESRLTFSNRLEQTLHRSLALANDASAKFATTEHLLLALTDDADASSALLACAVDVRLLQASLTKYLESGNPEKASSSDDSKPTAEFQRVIQRATIHVQSSGREEVNGANVLIAIFAERGSPAARILEDEFDVTRYDVVNFISHGIEKKFGTRGTNSFK
jgi:ATP-dependent Clp protease ATP-binding subunit ClpA